MQSTAEILARVEAEIRAGRAWRAKEILRGTIAAGRAEPAILEQYGRLLEHLGDRLEAGKYLFLSGVRNPDYAEAIALFRQRHEKGSGKDLAAQFPGAVRRRLRFDQLPDTVQRELRELGVPEPVFGPRRRESREGRTVFRRALDRVIIAGALLMTALFILALVLGIGVIGSWLGKLFD